MANQRLDFIDFAKGFAILSIVVFHYAQPYVSGIWEKAIMVGGTGVHLFFLLSAFGLGLSGTKLSPTEFYKKRFTKILIPYYLVVLAIFVINQLYVIYQDDGVYALLGHFFLFKMFDDSIVGSFGYHFWFVSTIVQFYLAFPLILALRSKMSDRAFLVGSLAISLIYWVSISAAGLSEFRIFNSFFLQYLWELSLGLVLAKHFKENGYRFWEQSMPVLALVAFGGLGLMGMMVLKGGAVGQMFNDIPASIGYLGLASLVFLFVSRLPPVLGMFKFIGKVSYEFYLIHMIVFYVMDGLVIKKLFPESSIFTAMLIILPVSLILSKYLSAGFAELLSGRENKKLVAKPEPS